MLRFQHDLVRIRLREKIQTRQLMPSPGVDHWVLEWALVFGTNAFCWFLALQSGGVPTGTPCWLSKMRISVLPGSLIFHEGSTNMNLIIAGTGKCHPTRSILCWRRCRGAIGQWPGFKLQVWKQTETELLPGADSHCLACISSDQQFDLLVSLIWFRSFSVETPQKQSETGM